MTQAKSTEKDTETLCKLDIPSLTPEQMASKSRRCSGKERLKQLLQLFRRDDRVLIVIMADPDSIASAFAMKRLLARRVEEVVIAHPNEIKRLNNIAMIELLKIPLERLKNIKPDSFTKTILIDSQPTHNPDLSCIKYDVVIDHHPITDGWSASFVDIRDDYGAVGTMMFEYLQTASIKSSVYLSTALVYAIKTDTQNFTKKAIQADVFCFQKLFRLINKNLLAKIESSDIRRVELKYFKTALMNMRITKNRIYVFLEKVQNPDILVVIADFLSTVHEIGWVIVGGRCGDKIVIIFRCDGYKKDAGKLANQVFGMLGSAGGHKQKARAEIPVKNLSEAMVSKMSTASLQKFFVKHLE